MIKELLHNARVNIYKYDLIGKLDTGSLNHCLNELEKNIDKLLQERDEAIELGRQYFETYQNTIKLYKPLKFEELKKDMWVWDNVLKRYMKVYDISYSEETFNVNGEWYLDDLHLEEFEFEENRFYRYEVAKDEL